MKSKLSRKRGVRGRWALLCLKVSLTWILCLHITGFIIFPKSLQENREWEEGLVWANFIAWSFSCWGWGKYSIYSSTFALTWDSHGDNDYRKCLLATEESSISIHSLCLLKHGNSHREMVLSPASLSTNMCSLFPCSLPSTGFHWWDSVFVRSSNARVTKRSEWSTYHPFGLLNVYLSSMKKESVHMARVPANCKKQWTVITTN